MQLTSRFHISLLLPLLAACTSQSKDDGHGGNRGTGGVMNRATTSVRQKCGIAVTTQLTDNGIGELRVGRSVDDIRHVCKIGRDTVIEGAEALPERIISVDLGRDTVNAIIDSGRIWRIEVEHPTFRTRDSLGVGTPLHRLLALPEVGGIEEEGVLFATTGAHCGLSFQLSYVPGDMEHRSTWDRRLLTRLPLSTTVVERVLVVGCRAR